MKPDRFARLKEIIFEATNLSEEERKTYLDEVCKDDPELRKEVEAVFAHESDQHEILKIGGAISFEPEAPSEPLDIIGHTLSHFRIDEKIAEGGMGVLYKATDLNLHRPVAIKVLRQDLLAHPGTRERFVREARSASALNHPGIVTVHEIDVDSGVDFIAMEYVEGRTLDEIIPPEGLSLESASSYALEVVEALQAAHEKGIVHRDLKPSNIMITYDNKVKILDFGIAKRLYPAPDDGTGEQPDTEITRLGGVIGTLRYLSPEQASGENVDHRTDIWSFGIILYEIVTGKLPFAGESKQDVVSAILNKAPVPMTDLRSGVPVALEAIVGKCLEKDRDERYQSAQELQSDLRKLQHSLAAGTAEVRPGAWKWKKDVIARRWSWMIALVAIVVVIAWVFIRDFSTLSEPPPPQRKMLVVLPFENLGSPEDEYFADGVTEELTARLASIGELGVIARTSAMKYKETNKTIRQIGEELGVEYILEGTIRWQRTNGGSRVRVTPQLIRVSDEIHLWAEVYEKNMIDIFQVQSEIASQVAENLNITLISSEQQAIEGMPTENPDAYHAYLRGLEYSKRDLKWSSTEEDYLMAVRMFERATQLDNTFALAYAKLSLSQRNLYHFCYHPKESLEKARDAAQKALELEPDLPDAHLAMGYYYYSLKNYDSALEEIRVANQLRLNDADILEAVAGVQRRSGDFEAAAETFEKASILNPHNVDLVYSIGETYMFLRDYQKVETYFNRVLSLAPDHLWAHQNKAANYVLWTGNTKKGREIVMQMPGELALPLAGYDTLEREYQSALSRYNSIHENIFNELNTLIPKALLIADIYKYMNQPKLAHAFYDSARIILEISLEENPDDNRIYSSLGMAYAGLGFKEDAIRMGETAVQLMPISRDALIGPQRIEDLAIIYTMVGEYDTAINQLEYLLSIPSCVSVHYIRVNPTWDPLRDHPRFQRLIAEGGEN